MFNTTLQQWSVAFFTITKAVRVLKNENVRPTAKLIPQVGLLIVITSKNPHAYPSDYKENEDCNRK